jgi:hypothetical protein
MLRRLFSRKHGAPRAARQQGDVHALDRSDDPRGGVQADEYRHADPTELVDAEGPAMMGPGGSAPDERSADERRVADRH